MSKKVKLPKIPDKEIKELVQACHYAFGNDEADRFMDEVFRKALEYRKKRLARAAKN